MSGFSFSKLKQAKPSMRRRLFLYMGALAALLLVTLFAVLLLLGQLKSPREELAKSLTFRMEAFQSDMESLWRNVSVMGLHLSEDMTAILEKQTTDLSNLNGDADAVERLEEAMLEPLRFILAERTKRFVLCTMAAGLPVARIQEMAGGDYPVIRIMPNTPASVGEGMIQYCSANVTAEEEAAFCRLMAPAGRLDAVAEGMIDAASCVSGCGPAWVYQFIEALADGGVACGLPRAKAQEYAAQMVLGSAKLVLESGKHPGALKDAVCSPGGSTIQGVRVLEEHGLRGAVMDAVLAAYDKTKEMGKG